MTNDRDIRERARVLRDWGRGISRHDESIRSRLSAFRIDGKPYDSAFVFVERGYNFKPTELQAAFGLAQLRRLKTFLRIREHNFKRLYVFFQQFREYFILPQSLPRTRTNWLAFPLTIRSSAPFERNAFVRYLEDHKIQTRPIFSGNILKHPAYQKIKHRRVGNFKSAQTIMERGLLVGMHHGLTDTMIDYVLEIFERFLRKKGVRLRSIPKRS